MQRVAFRIYGIMKFQLTNYLELTNNEVGTKIGGRAMKEFKLTRLCKSLNSNTNKKTKSFIIHHCEPIEVVVSEELIG